MKCPICYSEDTKVVNSRSNTDGFSIRRRRECLKCGFRFSTFEEAKIFDLCVVKNDNSRELYNRGKLINGLSVSMKKRPEAKEKLKNLVHLIERGIQKSKKSEIKSSELGEIVMKYLKQVDEIAYIRFASVHKSFDNMQTFKAELDRL